MVFGDGNSLSLVGDNCLGLFPSIIDRLASGIFYLIPLARNGLSNDVPRFVFVRLPDLLNGPLRHLLTRAAFTHNGLLRQMFQGSESAGRCLVTRYRWKNGNMRDRRISRYRVRWHLRSRRVPNCFGSRRHCAHEVLRNVS